MADMYAVSGETLTGIANAIRGKTGSDDFMTVASMASAIEGIGGGESAPRYVFRWDTYDEFMSSIIETGFEFRYPEDVVSFLLDNAGFLCVTISFMYPKYYTTYSRGCVIDADVVDQHNIIVLSSTLNCNYGYEGLAMGGELLVGSSEMSDFPEIVDIDGSYVEPSELIDFTITLTCVDY